MAVAFSFPAGTFAAANATRYAIQGVQIFAGLSRPHLANALAGRYPLSTAKVVSLRAFLDHPPPVVQPRLL